MATSAKRAQIVHVNIRSGESNVLVASSPDLKGLMLVSKDMDKLLAEIPEAIEALFAAAGVPVGVVRAESADDRMLPMIAMPREAAVEALRRVP